MHLNRSSLARLGVLAAAVAIIAAACGGATPTAAPSEAAAPSESAGATPSPTPLVTPEPVDASVPGPNGGQIIRWFVGLGAGGQPQQIQVQTDFVNAFNNDPANKDKAYISLEIYDNKPATRRTSSARSASRA